MNNEKAYLVNSEGEVLQVIDNPENYVNLQEGDKIIRNGTIDYLKNSIDIKYHFVKVNPKIYYKYSKKYSILDTLICHIGYMDNIVSYDNGKIVRIKGLPKLCEVSEATLKRQLKGLVEDDIVHKTKINKRIALMINPWLAMRGKRIYLSTYEEFKLSSLRNEVE